MTPFEDSFLAETVNDTITHFAATALNHFEEGDSEAAASIISEWTTDSDECILTHHYLDSLHTVADQMLYSVNVSDSIGYGTFTFGTTEDLPVD